jgi:hypothetical protein
MFNLSGIKSMRLARRLVWHLPLRVQLPLFMLAS